jgi:very-short-patch-repair endonuclease
MRVEPVGPLAKALRLCESPIEAQFLTAFFLVCVKEAQSPDRRPQSIDIGASCIDKYASIVIEPQVLIDSYRVDFLITYGTTYLVVECDGHDFHSLTEEQEINDRERDEWLVKHGYTVFRITGSEIFGDARACAERAFHRCTDDEHTPSWRRVGRSRIGQFYPESRSHFNPVDPRVIARPFKSKPNGEGDVT